MIANFATPAAQLSWSLVLRWARAAEDVAPVVKVQGARLIQDEVAQDLAALLKDRPQLKPLYLVFRTADPMLLPRILVRMDGTPAAGEIASVLSEDGRWLAPFEGGLELFRSEASGAAAEPHWPFESAQEAGEARAASLANLGHFEINAGAFHEALRRAYRKALVLLRAVEKDPALVGGPRFIQFREEIAAAERGLRGCLERRLGPAKVRPLGFRLKPLAEAVDALRALTHLLEDVPLREGVSPDRRSELRDQFLILAGRIDERAFEQAKRWLAYP